MLTLVKEKTIQGEFDVNSKLHPAVEKGLYDYLTKCLNIVIHFKNEICQKRYFGQIANDSEKPQNEDC